MIPDKTFYLDVWVKDGKLSVVSLDLTQFMKKPVANKKLAVAIAVNTSPAAVTAPTGATPLDVQALAKELPNALGSMSGGGAGLSSGSLGSAGSGGLSKADEKQARAQLKQSGLSDADIDRILGR